VSLKDGFNGPETGADYAPEPDELTLLERYRRLTSEDKTRLIAIGGALGEVERQEPESQ
jgi:hypothetical protein